ncbi:hypothetical protein [Nocardia aurea]|uniref:hypothetical protein n=1 Tax=Nocardia aurea TaxID=2144174 RepID=UPI0033BB64BC
MREDLIDSLTVDISDAEREPGETGDGASTREVAASLLETGWRPPVRVIKTVEQANALPLHAVVHDGLRAYSHHGGGWWIGPGHIGATHSEAVLEADPDGLASRKVVVIWEPANA